MTEQPQARAAAQSQEQSRRSRLSVVRGSSRKAAAADRGDRTEIIPLRSVGTASAAGPEEPAPVPEEHHLGDRLAAFVDGELDHDSRERVQAHLATCPECLAEAEEHRRLKDLLGGGAGPEPSSLFTARLMSIAASGADDGQEPPSGGGSASWPTARQGGFGSGGLGRGSFGRSSLFGSGALGAERPLPGVDPRAEREAGRALRPVAAASSVRSRRFVFAAAGAFSVAAVALSGAFTTLGPSDNTTVEEPYGNVSPVADTHADGAGPLFAPGPAPVKTALVQAVLPLHVPTSTPTPQPHPNPNTHR